MTTSTGRLPDRAFWENRRILVTGHTGFKGAWLTLWLQQLGAQVLGLSLAGVPSHPRLWEHFGLHEVEEIDADVAGDTWTQAVQTFAPNLIIHLAAQSLVPVGYDQPLRTYLTNTLGTARILDIGSHLQSVEASLVITTDKVYDARQPAPHSETDFLGGHDPYSASKAAAELVVSSWPTTTPPVATARAGNVIGGGDWSPHRLIPDLVRSWTKGRPVELRMPTAVRPWQHVLQPLHGYLIYAEDLASKSHTPRALNFGPDADQCIDVRTVTEHAASLWGASGRVVPNPASIDVPRSGLVETDVLQIDSTLATDVLGWRNVLTWYQALDWSLSWYLETADGASGRQVAERQLANYQTQVCAR